MVYRIQNLNFLENYYGKKRAIRGKNVLMLQSTQIFNQNGGINTIPIDRDANEFYMWYYSRDVQGLMGGTAIKLSYDQAM